jgi:hypothetical protein
MGIRIVNLRQSNGQPGIVKVDRSTVLGNPFEITPECDRYQSIAQYRVWLWERMREKKAVWLKLLELVRIYQATDELVLGCWCAPLKCHAEVIRAAIEWLDKQREW